MNTITRLCNRSLLTLPIAVCLLGFPPAVRADGESIARRFYCSASLGGAWIGSTPLTSSDPSFINPLQSGQVKFSPGVQTDIGFGYHINEWLAAELELGVAFNPIDSIGGNGSGGGNLTLYQIPILANVVFRLPTRSRFKPFIGLGVGGVQTELSDDDLFYGRSADDFGFAWQGFVGVRYELGSKWELGLVYNVLGTTERSFDAFSATMEGTQTQSLSVSVLFKF